MAGAAVAAAVVAAAAADLHPHALLPKTPCPPHGVFFGREKMRPGIGELRLTTGAPVGIYSAPFRRREDFRLPDGVMVAQQVLVLLVRVRVLVGQPFFCFHPDSRMKLISGTAHPVLANKISEYLGQNLTKIEVKRFPDGEIFVKILENIRGHDVFIIQPTCQPGNDNLMELLILMDACRRASAKRIICVLPYYGYARQDRKDQPRVPITAKLVANLLTTAGASRVLTVDLHSQQIQGFFDIPVDHLYASPVIVGHLKSLNLDNIVVVSPDTGGTKMAYSYAQLLNADIAIVAKNRRSATEVDVINVVGDVKGCNAVLVDDMTTTAGTLCAASRVLKANGAQSVMAAVSHSLLNQDGIDRLRNSEISSLVTTDSVPARVDEGGLVIRLSLSDLLGDAIMRIHNYQSVTSLFRIH